MYVYIYIYIYIYIYTLYISLIYWRHNTWVKLGGRVGAAIGREALDWLMFGAGSASSSFVLGRNLAPVASSLQYYSNVCQQLVKHVSSYESMSAYLSNWLFSSMLTETSHVAVKGSCINCRENTSVSFTTSFSMSALLLA